LNCIDCFSSGDRHGDIMMTKGICPVIKVLETPGASKEKERLLNYYGKNERRMQYHSFRERRSLIGSGAIRSGHGGVPRQCLKLSGQRWTMKGLRQMA